LLYFFCQDHTGPISVEGLGALLLAFDFKACRKVFEINTGRGFIYVLAALSAGADKGLRYVLFTYIQCLKLFDERLFFGFTDRKNTHNLDTIASLNVFFGAWRDSLTTEFTEIF